MNVFEDIDPGVDGPKMKMTLVLNHDPQQPFHLEIRWLQMKSFTIVCTICVNITLIDITFTITTSTWLLAIVIAAADVKPAMTGTDMKSIKNPSLVIKKDDCGQSDGDCGWGEVG